MKLFDFWRVCNDVLKSSSCYHFYLLSNDKNVLPYSVAQSYVILSVFEDSIETASVSWTIHSNNKPFIKSCDLL